MRLTINVPDNIDQRVIDAFTASFGYQAEITDERGNAAPNPQSSAQFVKAQVAQFIRTTVHNHEEREAGRAARARARDEVVIT